MTGVQTCALPICDRKDNVVIICSIENFDPMGVHTGDSITVAPIQTLTDREFQVMRDASFAIIREIGVETGGCPHTAIREDASINLEAVDRAARRLALTIKGKEIEVINKKPLGPSLFIIDDLRLWKNGHWQGISSAGICSQFRPGQIKKAYEKNDRYWILTNQTFGEQ